MFLVYLLVTPASVSSETGRFSTNLDEDVKGAAAPGVAGLRIALFTSNLIHAGFVVIVALLIALGISLCTKRTVLKSQVVISGSSVRSSGAAGFPMRRP